jgi:hypothetical protein
MDENKKRKYEPKKTEKNQVNPVEPRSLGLISQIHNPLNSKLELN